LKGSLILLKVNPAGVGFFKILSFREVLVCLENQRDSVKLNNLSFWRKWEEYIVFIPPVYAISVYCVGLFLFFHFSPFPEPVVSRGIIALILGLYLAARFFIVLSQPSPGKTIYVSIIIDSLVYIPLLLITRGIQSPFILLTLTPILGAGINVDQKFTFGIALLSLTSVLASHLFNPFYELRFGVIEISFFCIYLVAVSLSALLPYLINIQVKKQIQSRNIVQERQRVSREIHDGLAQRLAGLRWQIQLMEQNLEAKGIKSSEIKRLEDTVEKAYKETREYLQVLRSCAEKGGFAANLEECLKNLNEKTGLTYKLTIAQEDLPLSEIAEIELLRICQEALSNVKNHSAATKVKVEVIRVDGHINVNISDDGHGFDVLKYYNQPGTPSRHGLYIMHERAESIKGQCLILSKPGWGTEVQVKVPVYSKK
jgi:signal transduction histidine kinase